MLKKWSELKVGDVVRLRQADVVPADLILLAREDAQDEVYIRT